MLKYFALGLLVVLGLLVIYAIVDILKDKKKPVTARHRREDNVRRKWGEEASTGTIPSKEEVDKFINKSMTNPNESNAEQHPEMDAVIDVIYASSLTPGEKLLLISQSMT